MSTAIRGGVSYTQLRNLSGGRLSVDVRYADGSGGGGGGDHFDWQVYTPDEMCELGVSCHLTPIVVCADFDETRRPDRSKGRMQFVFERA